MLLKAFEIAEDEKSMRLELERREKRNQLVRAAFGRLKQQACGLEQHNPQAWLFGAFCSRLAPIMAPFLEEIDSALGVKGMKWSLEVYFEPNTVSLHGREQVGPCGLAQHAFYSHLIDHCSGVCIEANCSAAKIGFDSERAFEQHISNNKERFFNGDKPKQSVYFRRYACTPIHEACSEFKIGVLVLTSMQDEPFAPDVLDTLAFLSTLVSFYLYDYQRCFSEHQQYIASFWAQVPAPKTITATNRVGA
jgi:hypothetical protein